MRKQNLMFTFIIPFIAFAVTACGNQTESSVASDTIDTLSDTHSDFTAIDTSKTEASDQIYTEVNGETVSQGGPYGELSVTLPDNWTYELCPVDDGNLLYGDYGIHIHPKDSETGCIELAYAPSFAVCGTGLDEEDIILAGDEAWIGYYNQNVWDFVSYQGKNEDIEAITYVVDGWWAEYKDQAMDILNTMQFDRSKQTGAIWVYDPESEVNEIGLSLSANHVSNTGANLCFSQYDPENESVISINDIFDMERKNGDEWEELPKYPEVCESGDPLLRVETENKTEYAFDWEWLYGELEPGDYRITVSIHATQNQKSKDYIAYVHFALR